MHNNSFTVMIMLSISTIFAVRKIEIPLPSAFKILVGESESSYSARISYEFADLVLIDSQCGVHAPNCPIFCNDGSFSSLYCPANCRPTTPQSKYMLCGHAKVYDGSKSASAVRLKPSWKWQSAGTRMLYGHRWADHIAFTMPKSLHAPKKLFTMAAMRIVAANSMDQRIVRFAHVIMGLAPGPLSPASQLCRRFGLPPLLTVSLQAPAFRHRPLSTHNMRFGELDGARCRNWRFVDSLSKDKWAFPIDAVDFMGAPLTTEQTIGIFDHDIDEITVGDPIADEMLHHDVVEFYGETEKSLLYKRKCRIVGSKFYLPLVYLRVGDLNLTLTYRSTFTTFITAHGFTQKPGTGYPAGPFECLLNVQTKKTNPHATKRVWTFGRKFLEDYCVAFDYERNRIGFAESRKWSFPYAT